MLSHQREKLGQTTFCRRNSLNDDQRSCDFHFLLKFFPLGCGKDYTHYQSRCQRKLHLIRRNTGSNFFLPSAGTGCEWMTGNLDCWLTWIPVFVVNTLFPLLPWFEASDSLVLRWLFKTGRNTYWPGERHDTLLCFIHDTDTADRPMLSSFFVLFFKWNHLYFVWFTPSPVRPLVGPTTWNCAPNWRSAGSQTVCVSRPLGIHCS